MRRYRPLFLSLLVAFVSLAGVSLAVRAAAPTPAELQGMIEAEWLRQAPLLDEMAGKSPVGATAQWMTPEIDAASLVDGHKDGKWAIHTEREDRPWWQVDLGEPVALDRVSIFNRCDTGPEKASRIMVLLSNDGQTWRKVYQHDGTTFYGFTDQKPLVVDLTGETARYLRLQLPTEDYLYLDEVEIYAERERKKNVALGRPATQSSTSQWSTPPKRRAGASAVTQSMIDEAIALAERTLDMVAAYAPRPEFRRRLDDVKRRAETLPEAAAPDETAALYLDIRRMRRDLVLSHPLLDFERLLINKRPPPGFCHQTDQYLGRHSFAGPGLVLLDGWKSSPKETVLLEGKLPVGSVLHPELSYDASRVLFSYCDHTEPRPEHRRFFLYEIGLDGRGLRQVTGTTDDPLLGMEGRQTALIEDWDPCYLPDGGIAFVSTRNQGGVRCHHGGRYCPTYTLYRCEYDGSAIRPLVYGEANEWEPSLLHDGRIVWTRWDYINRHDTVYQSLWTIHPDGTGTAHLYGNYTRNPCDIMEARAIPGSRRIVATAAAHHSYTAGSIILVDPLKGQDGPEPLARVTPEIAFPETEGWPDASCATPWPLSEDLFLAAYAPQKLSKQGGRQQPDAFSVYLVDAVGGRELLYRDPETSIFSPIPIVPREIPPALPSQLPKGSWSALQTPDERPMGTFFVQNVYNSTQPIEPGSVDALRVVRIYQQPTQRVPDRSQVLFELPKEILGTVPVEEDGSVAFRAPAGVPLLFQLIDENEMSVMSMRSFVYLHPEEESTCVGCHEDRHSTPTPLRMPKQVAFRDLEPPVGPRYPGGLSFARSVQPVLDRYCIACHGLDETAGRLNLLGTIREDDIQLGRIHGSTAYDALLARPGLVAVALRNQETPYSKPKDYFSHAGRLARLLLEGDEFHEPIDRESFLRVVHWLDLNAQFFGDYSWNKREWLRPDPVGEQRLREEIRKSFGEDLASQPFAALVNMSLPSESRILKGPLAGDAGGWATIDPKWSSEEDDGYQRMRRLVEALIPPLATRDICGTCNQTPCECKSCWIRDARAEWLERLDAGAE